MGAPPRSPLDALRFGGHFQGAEQTGHSRPRTHEFQYTGPEMLPAQGDQSAGHGAVVGQGQHVADPLGFADDSGPIAGERHGHDLITPWRWMRAAALPWPLTMSSPDVMRSGNLLLIR